MKDLKAVSTDDWAASLISAGLEPGPALAYQLANGPYEVAVHIATHDDLSTNDRAQLVEELQKEISSAVHRVLGRQPVTVLHRYADGSSTTDSFADHSTEVAG